MRAVVQTVSRASVTVDGEVVGAITDGRAPVDQSMIDGLLATYAGRG